MIKNKIDGVNKYAVNRKTKEFRLLGETHLAKINESICLGKVNESGELNVITSLTDNQTEFTYLELLREQYDATPPLDSYNTYVNKYIAGSIYELVNGYYTFTKEKYMPVLGFFSDKKTLPMYGSVHSSLIRELYNVESAENRSLHVLYGKLECDRVFRLGDKLNSPDMILVTSWQRNHINDYYVGEEHIIESYCVNSNGGGRGLSFRIIKRSDADIMYHKFLEDLYTTGEIECDLVAYNHLRKEVTYVKYLDKATKLSIVFTHNVVDDSYSICAAKLDSASLSRGTIYNLYHNVLSSVCFASFR